MRRLINASPVYALSGPDARLINDRKDLAGHSLARRKNFARQQDWFIVAASYIVRARFVW